VFYLNYGDQVPDHVKGALQTLVENPRLLSTQLAALFALVKDNKTCHLHVQVSDSGNGGHGDTGSYINLPGAKATEATLIQEAFMTKRSLILEQHTWFVEVTIDAGPESDAAAASTTLMHELELHAVPAGLLLQGVARANPGDDARLGLVLAHMRQADQHVDLDRQEQYVRAAARIRSAVRNDEDLAWWGADLLKDVAEDAIDQFEAYENEATDGNSAARVQWLRAVIDAIKNSGPDAPIQVPKPAPRQARVWAAVADVDVPGLMARRVSARIPMVDVVDEARTVFTVPVSHVLDLYCRQVVPALLAQAPGDLTDKERKWVFLTYHGVEGLAALDAIDASGTTPVPGVNVVSAWPPPDMRVLWLTDGERHPGSWSQLTALPQAVKDTTGFVDDSRIYLDGQVYRVAVRDTKPDQKPKTTKFFEHKGMGKFIALLKQRR
jgi:hypothetical protein